jgi:hypothetical protein
MQSRSRSILLCLTLISLLLVLGAPILPAAETVLRTQANVPVEISLTAAQAYGDPFNEVTLDVLFTDPAGVTRTVPAFWAGGNVWKVRYASPLPGLYRYRSVCSATADTGLHGVMGAVRVARYTGTNPLYRHGPIRVGTDGRHFTYGDGVPFFWLGDTWWMGLCHRLHWPDEFQRLTADRRAKGFNVVQIVMGLYPDMPPFDPRGANEAGFPWEPNYTRLRPEYFDMADRRLAHLVESGITPCIVGAWGYFMPWMGPEKLKQHWRYLVARYGAWPVVWCVAGEANLPYYLTPGFPYDDRAQVHGWTEVLRYVRDIDPWRRPLSLHPTGLGGLSARGAIDDVALLDFDMLQTGHGGREVLTPTVETVRASRAAAPIMPVLDSEVCYEALLDRIPADVVRLMFWASILSGAAGHTYGANGIWQCNRQGQPHGPSPHGGSYGTIPWDQAMNLPGSGQLGMAKRFLADYPWQQIEPRPDWAAWQDAGKPPLLGDWIWFPEGDPKLDAPTEARFFRRTFDLPQGTAVSRARLALSVDDRFTVWINGHEAGSGANWKEPATLEVRPWLKPGRNVISVRGENMPAPVPRNPAGLIAGLNIELADGRQINLSSDASWRVSRKSDDGWREPGFNDLAWAQATVTAKYGEAPWGTLGGEQPDFVPYAAAIGDRLRLVYTPTARPILLKHLRSGAAYQVTLFDPVTGHRTHGATLKANASGEARLAPPANAVDWLVVLEQR